MEHHELWTMTKHHFDGLCLSLDIAIACGLKSLKAIAVVRYKQFNTVWMTILGSVVLTCFSVIFHKLVLCRYFEWLVSILDHGTMLVEVLKQRTHMEHTKLRNHDLRRGDFLNAHCIHHGMLEEAEMEKVKFWSISWLYLVGIQGNSHLGQSDAFSVMLKSYSLKGVQFLLKQGIRTSRCLSTAISPCQPTQQYELIRVAVYQHLEAAFREHSGAFIN